VKRRGRRRKQLRDKSTEKEEYGNLKTKHQTTLCGELALEEDRNKMTITVFYHACIN
jgi:hypothetical protein